MQSGHERYNCKKSLAKNLNLKKISQTNWSTPAGDFQTNHKTTLQFTLPEFHTKKLVTWEAYVTEQPMNYDSIIGRELMSKLGIIIDFKNQTLEWDDMAAPMKTANAEPPSEFYNTNSV